MSYIDPKIIQEYVEDKDLGSGSDGIAVLYKHKDPAQANIAVKYPRSRQDNEAEHEVNTRRRLLGEEVTILKTVSQHQNIVELLGWDDSWTPEAPALFFEYCSLGDGLHYYHTIESTLKHIPEMTLWKLMADISQALDYLHNSFEHPIIHGDVKPQNILVQPPSGQIVEDGQAFFLPTFKLADFSRSRFYRPDHGPISTYQGTSIYAPPLAEQQQDTTPASDIWSLGATVQFFAYGRDPVQDIEDLVKDLRAQGITSADLPNSGSPEHVLKDWWRKWPVVYRPLMMANPPYSIALNKWYSMCMRRDMETRIKAADLVGSFVPVASRQIEILGLKREAREGIEVGSVTSSLACT